MTHSCPTRRSSDLDPQKAETYEIGGKWDVIHEALSLDVALFRTTVSNEINSQDTIDGVALQTGKKRVQGVELSAIGNITDNWAISAGRSEEHTSELQSLMRISYAVFCLKNKRRSIRSTKNRNHNNAEQY